LDLLWTIFDLNLLLFDRDFLLAVHELGDEGYFELIRESLTGDFCSRRVAFILY
jgi:hypothetical protein